MVTGMAEMSAAPQAVAIRLGADDRGRGWVVFAAALLMTLGTLNVIDGVAAIGNSQFFARHAHYLVGDLDSWGWVLAAIGCCQAITGFAIARGSDIACWAGIGFALANALAQLLFIQAYPWWSLAIFTVDLLVVYALVVYGPPRLVPA
jgi:hypothetical protein